MNVRYRYTLILCAFLIAIAFPPDTTEGQDTPRPSPSPAPPLLPTVPSTPPAAPTGEPGPSATDFDENLYRFSRLWVELGITGYTVELVVFHWGGASDGKKGLRLSVPQTPSFISAVRFPDGEELVFEEDEYEKKIVVEFDTVATVTGNDEEELLLQLDAQEDEVHPNSRVFAIPLQPTIREESAVVVLPLKEDAPDEISPEEAIDFCDTAAKPVYTYDRVALFFTPWRDLQPPLTHKHFIVEVYTPSGKRVTRLNVMFTKNDDGDVVPSVPFAKEGSPGMFVTFLDFFHREPGIYTVKSSAAYVGTTGLFGLGDTTIYPAEDFDGNITWQDEGTFELAGVRLQFQGFVMESVRLKPLDEPHLLEGSIHMEEKVNGSTVTVSSRAEWQWAKLEEGRKVPAGRPQHIDGQLVLEFPAELDPGGHKVGTLRAVAHFPYTREQAEEHARGAGSSSVRNFSYGVWPLTVIDKPPPDRFLVEGSETPAPWGHSSLGSSTLHGEAMNLFFIAWNSSPEREITLRGPRRFNTAGLAKEELSGRPERATVWHIRDPDALWVLPVSIHYMYYDIVGFGRHAPIFTAYGYGIYRSKPGRYASPLPQDGEGGPDTGDTDDDTPPSSDDEHGDTAAIDRGPLIRAWVAAAQPPENALYGANLRYNPWGVKIGTTRGGRITPTPGKPDAAAGSTPEDYLWESGQAFDSVDHCTLGEYVEARLNDKSIAHCRGRYRRADDDGTPGIGSDTEVPQPGDGDGGVRRPNGDDIGGLGDDTDHDTTPDVPVNETDETLGDRPQDLDDPGFDALDDAIQRGDTDAAEDALDGLTGTDSDENGSVVDVLVDESRTEDDFDRNNTPLDSPHDGPEPPSDADVSNDVGLDPNDVTGPIVPTGAPPGIVPGDLTPPPPRPVPPNDPFIVDRGRAHDETIRIIRDQEEAARREDAAATDAVRNHPIPTRGGMDGIDVGPIDRVTLSMWDHGQQDGDRVRVVVGGRTILQDLSLTNQKQSFQIQLTSTFTSINIVAHNEGTASPNTASIEVSGGGRVLASTQWNLKSYDMGSTLIRRAP